MAQVEKYEHHDVEVTVISAIKGKHRDICLCFQGCKLFKPGETDNCQIAAENYAMCVKYHITAPVGECPKYEAR